MALNERQKMFVKIYLTNGRNATQAAIAAGYSPDSAPAVASRLLTDAKVHAIVRMATAEAEADLDRKAALLGITKAKMLRRLRQEASVKLADFYTVFPAEGGEGDENYRPLRTRLKGSDDWTPAMKSALKRIKVGKGGEIEIELHSPKDAREQICKLLGWNREQLEISGSIDSDVQVHVNLPDNKRGDTQTPSETKIVDDGASKDTPSS